MLMGYIVHSSFGIERDFTFSGFVNSCPVTRHLKRLAIGILGLRSALAMHNQRFFSNRPKLENETADTGKCLVENSNVAVS